MVAIGFIFIMLKLWEWRSKENSKSELRIWWTISPIFGIKLIGIMNGKLYRNSYVIFVTFSWKKRSRCTFTDAIFKLLPYWGIYGFYFLFAAPELIIIFHTVGVDKHLVCFTESLLLLSVECDNHIIHNNETEWIPKIEQF